MIIINWFISNIPTTVFVFGASSMKPEPYLAPYAVWERLQLSLYFVQETSISILYVYEIVQMLRPHVSEAQSGSNAGMLGSSVTGGSSRKWRSVKSRQVLKHLIYISCLIVAMDISLMITEFVGHYEIQVLYKVSRLYLPHPNFCKTIQY
jgi:hypothetical protein